MANLTFELNIYSAKDLDNVNLITKMDVYAVAWICGDDSLKNQKEKTVVDRTGGSETTWNHAVKFSIDQRLVHEGRLTLVVKLMCERIFGDKDLGEVQVPILELFTSSPPSNGDGSGNNQVMKFVTYQVKTPCGRGKGSLTFSYRFVKPPIQSNPEPIHQNPINSTPGFPSTTYPPSSISYPSLCEPPHTYQYESPYPPQSSSSNFNPPSSFGNSPPHSYLYPPPPNNSGHAYHQAQPSQACYGYASPYEQNQYGNVYPPSAPNQNGYGYPPPPSAPNHQGYGYPPPPPPPQAPGYGYGSPPQPHGKPPKKNNAGIGFGAGIVGGALGGLLLGDIVSDVDFF